MGRKRRFSAEFRVQAVRLLNERLAAGHTAKRVGDELEIEPDLLLSWAKEVDQAPAGTPAKEIFPGYGRKRSYIRRDVRSEEPIGVESPEEELKRLRRENERLRQERDFLKKAAAFFAKESQ
jgi:transposase-like protein